MDPLRIVVTALVNSLGNAHLGDAERQVEEDVVDEARKDGQAGEDCAESGAVARVVVCPGRKIVKSVQEPVPRVTVPSTGDEQPVPAGPRANQKTRSAKSHLCEAKRRLLTSPLGYAIVIEKVVAVGGRSARKG